MLSDFQRLIENNYDIIHEDDFPALQFSQAFTHTYKQGGSISQKLVLAFFQVQLNNPEFIVNDHVDLDIFVDLISDYYIRTKNDQFLEIMDEQLVSLSLWEFSQSTDYSSMGKFNTALQTVRALKG